MTIVRYCLIMAAFLFIGSYSYGQSTGYNYVATYTARVPITVASNVPGNTVANVNQTVQYLDGLGRPIQTVQTKASPEERDIVQPMAYDQYDREAVKYLPYVVGTASPDDGSYKTTAISDQASFYANPSSSPWSAPGVVSTPYPTAATSFEPSPLNRVIEQGFPGDNWQLTGTTGATNPGHTVKTVYATNNATALPGYWAKDYIVTYIYSAGQYIYKNDLTDRGSYPYGSLYVTVTRNENWSASQTNLSLNTTEEYKDKLGQVVLKRTFNYNTVTSTTETLSTYYVYDGFGNLTYVLPPGANPDAGGITQTVLDNLCYQYRYDGRNRMIEKKIPGKGWEYIIYNNLNQVIGTQDSVQRMKPTQQVSYIKYDSQGRPIISGYYTIPSGTPGTDYRTTLQATADAQTVLWETKNSSGVYSNVTVPTSGATKLTINYYDDYSASGIPATTYAAPTGASTMTRGLLTATETAVLNTPADLLWGTNYYDDLGRVSKSYMQHYLGGHTSYSVNNYDAITNYYNFTNQIDTTIRQHFTSANTTNPRVTVGTSYTYDQVGRKLHIGEQIAGSNGVEQSPVYLSLSDYNEVGQVTDKRYRSGNGTTYLTEVGYSYNERGWLTALTPLSGTTNYGETIYYNTPTGTATPQFNGNISQFSYNSPNMELANGGTSSSLNTISYTYDNLSRFTQSQSTLAVNDETAKYDLMGNISSLARTGPTGSPYIGSYVYAYNTSSNQLHTVNLNEGVHNLKTYTYDGNGNTTSDSTTKKLTYNLLNMPEVFKKGTATLATYTYDASGNKLRDVSTSYGTWDYINGIVYKNGQIAFIQNDEGRDTLNSDSITYHYIFNLKDYLGNVRASYDNSGTGGTFNVLQEDDYYPFGLSQLYLANGSQNRYLYNGKEQQFDLADEYDYGARFYDPVVARWEMIDPLAEKMRRYSPYNYGLDNPVRFIDADGMGPGPQTPIGEGETLEDLQKFYGSSSVQVYTYDPDVTQPVAKRSSVPKPKGPKPSGFSKIPYSLRMSIFRASKPTKKWYHSDKQFYSRYDPITNKIVHDGGITELFPETSILAVGAAYLTDGLSYEAEASEELSGGLNLYKVGSAQANAEEWNSGSYFLNLPKQGSEELNWIQNSNVLQEEMNKGNPIFDSFKNEKGELIPTEGFLGRERNFLEANKWTFNAKYGAWFPPR